MTGHGFDRGSAKRISDTVRDRERQPRPEVNEQWTRASNGGGLGVKKVTNTYTAWTAGTTRVLDLYYAGGGLAIDGATVLNPDDLPDVDANANAWVAWDGEQWVVLGQWCAP